MRIQYCLSALLLTTCVNSGGAVEVVERPLPIKAVRAFENLRVRRPVVVTNAGDGSNRLFLVTQQGVIHVIDNDPATTKTRTFLDIESRVVYKDHENEEGLLGLAFHPNFKDNGAFFVYYSTADAPHTSVISRYRAADESLDEADPDSEEELLRIKQPFWNHNGGALTFGPDGYLYVALGDGGYRADPQGNGQNLGTLLGSILRIDVDRKSPGKSYGIPTDNPFVGREGARGEIWAYGLRNVWGMSFDRETGDFWAADVGQDIWEEIDIIVRGGNYGWNVREGKHAFAESGSVVPPGEFIEPVWEYHHDVGKSITGGVVYRGTRLPELVGCFLYADYVTGRIWLEYDRERKQVVANHALKSFNNAPLVAFGEDEQGEVLFTDSFGNIYRLEREE